MDADKGVVRVDETMHSAFLQRQVSIGLCLVPCRAVEMGQVLLMPRGTHGMAERKGEE